MKDFFKNILATAFGVFLSIGLIIAFGIVSIIGTIASSTSEPKVKDNSVLVLNLQGQISEQGGDDYVAALTGGSVSSLGLNDILASIDKAKVTDRVKGIYINAGVLQTDYATLQEIRQKLVEFKASKKWIVAYADAYMQGTYWLASVADKVYLNPKGAIDWHGVGAQPQYYRDLLAKLGVKMQVVKVGTYKSATEQYTESGMSEANREQVSAYVTGLWQNVLRDVAEARHIPAATLNQYADGIMALDDPATLKSRSFVDGLLYADEMKAEIRKRLGLNADDDIPQVSVSAMNAVSVKEGRHSDNGDEIAVYYCQGDIVMSEATSLASLSSTQIVATKVCEDLEKFRDDDDVKAVVLRINSGGGDAYASEQIWHAVGELKKQKPVVVSMGGMAASGAYYMSANASWIVAEPTTLTGSIGIFGLFPDMSGLLTEKLGVRFDEVKTNRNSTFSPIGTARPMNAEEAAYMQTYINRDYELFRQRVADGRKIAVADVEKIAQGRVWLGQAAKPLRLVDELGTLDTAIAKAAALAKMKRYHTTDYPTAEDVMTQLMNRLSGSDGGVLDASLREVLGAYYEPFVLLRTIQRQSPIQARIPFVITNY